MTRSDSRRLVLERGTARYRLVAGGCLLAALVVALAIPQVSPPYRVFQWTLVLIFTMVALGLNLLVGFNGQISLGHSAFFAVGAYTAAILIDRFDAGMVVNVLVAAPLTFLLGLLFGIPALRLKGLYLALVTLGLAVVTPPLIKRFEGLSGGVQGINVPQATAPAWSGLADDQWLYYVVLAVTLAVLLVGWNLVRSPVGRALVAVRDNEIVATTLGVDLARTKTLVFAWSAMFAGVAGVFYTYVVGFVSPDSFNLTLTIGFLAAVVVGGVATIFGALLGAMFIEFVPVYASDVNPALGGLIYGLALILVMLVARGGIVGLAVSVRDRFVDVRGLPAEPGAPAGPRRPAAEADPARTPV